MVGLIHTLLFTMIESMAGQGALDEVKQRAGLPADRAYRINENYDDGEWQRLLASACDVLQVTQAQAELALAEFFYRDAVTRWPMWFAMSHGAREFLERQPRIHNSMAGGLRLPAERRAVADKFTLESQPAKLVVRYRSPNRLCGLYRALAQCVIDHYGETAVITEVGCQKHGAEACEIHICWPEPGGSS